MKKLLLLVVLLTLRLHTSLRADTVIVFNEIMYHPATNEAAMKWIELKNQMAVDVDISGWSIAGNIQYSFPSNSIVRGGSLLVVAASPDTLMGATALTNVAGPFTGTLSNNAANLLQLFNNSGRVVDQITYGVDGDWPVTPDGSGVSLAKLDRDTASGPPEHWAGSEQVGGTPGAENFPFFNNVPPATKLLSIDTAWKYEDSGTDLGGDWRNLPYDDSSWGTRSAVTNRVLPGLFNTGVNTNGAVLTSGARDPHYIITAAAQGPVNTNAIVMVNNTAWLANDTASSWIGVVSSGAANANAGGYNYQTTFSLKGFLLGTVQLNSLVGADDALTNVFLNGLPSGLASTGFAAYSPPLALNSGFVDGTNTLEFRTVNGGTSPNPHGFRAVLSGAGLAVNTNTPLASGRSTYYFRKSFIFSGAPARTQLRLSSLVADGAVFYLNGVEVYRQNMPDGSIDYSTPALSAVSTPASTGQVSISSSSLVAGSNLLAVEVHLAADNAAGVLNGAELFSTPLPPLPLPVVFNELSAPDSPEFWLELANYGTNAVVLDGYVIHRDGLITNDYVFPSGNLLLAPGAFLAITNTVLGFHPVLGDKLYLYSPTRSSVLDGVWVQSPLRGRYPDGTGAWLFPDMATPGSSNSFAFHNEIVINEIMYHHSAIASTNNLPPQQSSETWLELFNRSANAVNLTGWGLSGAINYHFAAGKILPPGGYLVVAKDAAALRAIYPSIDIAGNFGGNLPSKGSLIVLADPAGNPADQVRYFKGGRWPDLANGGGSSLELRDPNADNSKAEAWAASDESAKSSWQNYSYRAVATIPAGSGQPTVWNDFIFGLLSNGECLIDDLSVVESPTNNPIQLIANGDFENGLAGWRLIGNQGHSRLEMDPGNPGNHVLHVVATGPQEHMHNHIETTYINGRSVMGGRQYQISFRAKWLAGNNLLNTRLYFNRVSHTTALPIPSRNGTPGGPNSQAVANIGPTFSQFQHRRVIPPPGEPVTVSVVAQDPQGVSACEVWWSANGGAWSNATMTNQASDLYAGVIPGYAAGTIVQFYVRAIDGLGAASTFPAAGPDSGALYAVADGQAKLTLAHNVRIVLTPANISLLHAFTNVMSNDNLPCTVIYDEKRAYYDMGVRLKGSERGRYSDTRVSFHLTFGADELFRGVHPTMLIDRSGAGDATANKQQEIVIKHMLMHAGGIPGTYSDLCRVIAPMSIHTGAGIFFPRQEDEFIETAFANGGNGTMWELELIYYPTSTNQFGYKNPQPDNVIGTDISNLGDDKEIYRYNFILKDHRDVNDYGPFINFAKTCSLTGPQLEQQIKQVMDVDEWTRAFALVTLCGVGDTYTFGNNHNLLMYLRPSDQKMLAFPWDMDFSFVRGTSDPLVGDQNIGKIMNLTANLRIFYAQVLDIIGSTYNPGYMTYWATRYGDFCPGQDFSGVIPYMVSRGAYAKQVIANAGGNSPFALSGANSITTTNNLITLSGTAPVQVKTITINGAELPITWTSIGGWTFRLPIHSPTTNFTIQGFDFAGNAMPGFLLTATVNYTGPIEAPQGKVVINEIMYNPLVPATAYVELFNSSSRFTFDLSGWRFEGLGYTFPAGAFLAPGAFLVLAKDPAAFSTAFGAATPVYAAFSGNLQTNSQTLTLIQPGPTPDQDVVINKVRYENVPPWPTGPNGSGFSLQLIDATQDNARPSNWADGAGWRLASVTGNTGSSSNLVGTNFLIYMQAAGEAYIDDISLVPLSGPNAGSNLIQDGDFEAPLSGSWVVPTTMGNSALSTTYAHSGNYSLHVVATNSGSIVNSIRQALPPLNTNILCTISFWYRTVFSTNVVLRVYPGSGLNANVNQRPTLATPGATNSVVASLPSYPPLWLNEVQPDNLNGIIDSAGQYDPWVELYNPSPNSLLLDGYFLANNYSNLFQWSFPTGIVINPGEFKVIFADGETNDATASELHTSFGLSSGSGSIALSRSYNGKPQVLDYLNYDGLAHGRSYGSFPDGQPFDRQDFYYVTAGATNNGRLGPLGVIINEWMASNTKTLADLSSGAPKYDDWFELYNPGQKTVSLGGYFLTGTLTNKLQFQIPNGYTIPAAGYLLVWADSETNQNSSARPDLHVNFQLSKKGDAIGLFTADGTQIDAVTFGVQTNDVSQGRCPDGAANIVFFPTPTPLAPNTCPANTPPVLGSLGDKFVHKGQTLIFTAHATDSDIPAQTLTFSLDNGAPAEASINSSSGVFTWPTGTAPAPSTNFLTVRVVDNGTPSLGDSEIISVVVLGPLHFGQLSRTGQQLTLMWETAPGLTYRVEYNDNLDTANWIAVGADLPASGNSLSMMVDMGSLPGQRFYRIRVVN